METKSFSLSVVLSSLKRSVIRNYHSIMRKFKAPRMLWGYENYRGEYCDRTRISDTVFFYHKESIKISDNVFVWHYSILDGTGGLEIGEGTQIGAWVGIFTHSSHIAIRIYGNHYQNVHESKKLGYPISPVKIGKYTFIGAGSKILPGVSIGNGAIISAGSIVNRDVNDFEIVAGNPAKVIGNTKEIDKLYLEDPQLLDWYNEWANTITHVK
jgi:acetyltransferase-like isoleucine patch superfamily enzyme